MRLRHALLCVLSAMSSHFVLAEDIVTIKGETFTNLTNYEVKKDGIQFTTDSGVTKIKFKDMKPEDRKRFGYDPFEAGLYEASMNRPLKLSLKDAFRLSEIEQAKAKAAAEGKLLGFVMVWDVFFKEPARPMGGFGPEAMAHLYQTFNDAVVLVFVRHEDELGSVPPAVHKGFTSPDERGFAPNICITDADAKEFIVEIPVVEAGKRETTGKIREKVFREGITKIREYLAQKQGTPGPEVTTNSGTSVVTNAPVGTPQVP